jgi:hypothetical protein
MEPSCFGHNGRLPRNERRDTSSAAKSVQNSESGAKDEDESMKAAVWSIVVAVAIILGGRATAAGQPAPADLSATPALAEAEQKIRTELALTPEQEAKGARAHHRAAGQGRTDRRFVSATSASTR